VHHAYSKKIVKIPVGLPVAPGTSENFFKYGTREKMKTKASAAQKNSTMIPGFFSVLQLNKMVLFQISKVMTSSHNNNNNQNKKYDFHKILIIVLLGLLQQNKCVEQPEPLIHSTLLPTIITIGLHSGLPNLRKNGHGLFRGMIFLSFSFGKTAKCPQSNPLDVMRVRITQKV